MPFLVSFMSGSGDAHSDCLDGIKCVDPGVCCALLRILTGTSYLAVLGQQVDIGLMGVGKTMTDPVGLS